jgi:hypothetical protein
MQTSTKKKKTQNVIIVMKGTAGTLKIDDHEVSANALKQTIRWELDSSLDLGDFTSFTWVDPTGTTSTFDAPEISADGNSLTIGDHNGPTAKKGGLAYIITVELDGSIYTSNNIQAAALMRDPIIINK